MALATSVATKKQNVFPPRASIYIKNASGTVNLSRDFKGFGALLAYSVPLGQTVTAIMLPPTGPRSKGHPFRAQITGGGGGDVVVFET